MKISIITAVFNKREFIEGCIKSVISQDYKDIEYILIDGGSTDGTMEVVNKYSDKITIVISEKDRGIFDALNKGVRIATGDYVGFLHSDDIYSNNGVIGKVADLLSVSGSDSLYGDLEYVSKRNTDKVIRYWKAGGYKKNAFMNGWMPPHPTLFIRKQAYDKYGYFDTSLKVAADYELTLRFLYKNNISAVYLPDVLIKMRLGGNSNRNITNITRKMKEDYIACRRYGLGWYTVLMKNIRKAPQFLLRK